MWESPVDEFEGLDLRYPNLDTDEAYLRVNYSGSKGKMFNKTMYFRLRLSHKVSEES